MSSYLLIKDAMPGHRRPALPSSLLLSVSLHVAGLVGLAVWSRTVDDAEPAAVDIEYVETEPGAPPDQQLPPMETDGTPAFDPAPLQIGDLQIDIAKVRSRLPMLFPFLTLDMRFLDRVSYDSATAARSVGRPYGHGVNASEAPALQLTDDELQDMIDKAWSRRERWQTFAPIAGRLASHDPHDGRASELVREYLDQNILQPYCDGATRDPRYWAMMENAADHADFIDFIRSYARRYPVSRTTTELLFLLDELAQGSRDVVMMMIDTRPEDDLRMTKNVAPDGFDTAVEIKEKYGRWLFDRGWDKGFVRRHYNDVRLRILQTIVTTTPRGHRRGDAQFLAGQVLFEMNRVDDAVRIWRSIAPIRGDAYYRAYAEMLDVLGDGPPDVRSIQRVLSREYGRWRVYSIDRLRAFGHWCDTF